MENGQKYDAVRYLGRGRESLRESSALAIPLCRS